MNIIQNKQKLLLILGALLTIIIVALLIQNNLTDLFNQTKNTGNIVSLDKEEFIKKQKEVFGQREAINPKDSSAKRELSRAYYLSGDYEKAETLIKEAIALDGSNPQFYVDLGRIYEAKKDTTNAEKMYKKAIELNTKEIQIKNQIPKEMQIKIETTKEIGNAIWGIPTPYTALAVLYLNTNKPEKSVPILLEGIKIDDKYPYFYSLLSDVYEKLGDVQKTKYYEEQFQKLVKTN